MYPPGYEFSRQPRPQYWLYQCVEQECEETGELISPLYAVPRSPSIIATPPGISPGRIWEQAPQFYHQYQRMVPQIAKHLNFDMDQYYDEGEPYEPASEDERYQHVSLGHTSNSYSTPLPCPLLHLPRTPPLTRLRTR
ncbi:hypothetical protein F5Y15DRAFT_186232 [Xylariaceae sp. FL0016]|nr:hypothetical protein F5Y15DRAFT_186232 [Xylariaceae sp. FL0016]